MLVNALLVLVGIALLAASAWCFWSSWADVVRAVAWFRAWSRRRALAREIIAVFERGNAHVDLETLALRIAGESVTLIRKIEAPPARARAERLLAELEYVARSTDLLEPWSEGWDYAQGENADAPRHELCQVPGLYVLSAKGRALVGGGA